MEIYTKNTDIYHEDTFCKELYKLYKHVFHEEQEFEFCEIISENGTKKEFEIAKSYGYGGNYINYEYLKYLFNKFD